MKTQYLCFPVNTKPTTTTTASSTTNGGRGVPPSSLLDRFREAVFRLIMATALSKANNNNNSSSSSPTSRLSPTNKKRDYRRNNSSSSNIGHESVRRSCYLNDPYHSEALADCIEFIKKKSATSSPSDHIRLHDQILDANHHDDSDTTRGSTASCDVNVVISLPVM